MRYTRAWLVLLAVWAAGALMLAPMIMDALRYKGPSSNIFFWFLLVSAGLIPLAHEFIHPKRPYRLVILLGLSSFAAFFAYHLLSGWRTGEVGWIPIIWVLVLWSSDWLFLKAQASRPAPPATYKDDNWRPKENAERNISIALEGFEANVAEFREIFLDQMPKNTPAFTIGPVSSHAIIDFNSTKIAMQIAFAAFFVVFQRVYEDARNSVAYAALLERALGEYSEVKFAEQHEKMPYLTEAEVDEVWERLKNPKYQNKMDTVRLAVLMLELSTDSFMKPPLVEDKDREALTLLMKRTLGRMRVCLKKH